MEWIIALVVVAYIMWNTTNNVKMIVQNENAMTAAKWAANRWLK